jgi:hypothetical protein
MSLEAKWEILSGKLREGFWEKTSGMKDLSGNKLPITYDLLPMVVFATVVKTPP